MEKEVLTYGKSRFDISTNIVATIPPGYSYAAVNSFYRAFTNAGFNSESFPRLKEVLLVVEPDAASAYIAKLRNENNFLRKNDPFILCDAGAGRVNVSSYIVEELHPQLRLRTVAPPDSTQSGSLLIDHAFKKWLHGLLGDKNYFLLNPANDMLQSSSGVRFENPAMRQLMQAFETLKHMFHNNSKPMTMDLPPPLHDLEIPGIVHMGEILITRENMESFFEASVKDIHGLIQQQAAHIHAFGGVTRGKDVHLVGGLGNSPYLKSKLSDLGIRSDYRYPLDDRWTAVLKGAVVCGMEKKIAPGMVRAGSFRHSYAVHAVIYRGISKADSLTWLVKKGDLLTANSPHIVTQICVSWTAKKGTVQIPIYRYAGDTDSLPTQYKSAREDLIVACTLSRSLNDLPRNIEIHASKRKGLSKFTLGAIGSYKGSLKNTGLGEMVDLRLDFKEGKVRASLWCRHTQLGCSVWNEDQMDIDLPSHDGVPSKKGHEVSVNHRPTYPDAKHQQELTFSHDENSSEQHDLSTTNLTESGTRDRTEEQDNLNSVHADSGLSHDAAHHVEDNDVDSILWNYSEDERLINPSSWKAKLLVMEQEIVLRSEYFQDTVSEIFDPSEYCSIMLKIMNSISKMQKAGYSTNGITAVVARNEREQVAELVSIPLSQLEGLRNFWTLSPCLDFLRKVQLQQTIKQVLEVRSKDEQKALDIAATAIVKFLDLAVISYAGAHIEDPRANDPRFNMKIASDIIIGKHLTLRPRRLQCLDAYFHHEKVWVFEELGPGKQPSDEPLYLLTTMEIFSDIWGPVWKVQKENIIRRFNVSIGSIFPWTRGKNDPTLHDDEIFAHWTDCETDYVVDDAPSFPRGAEKKKVLIGADTMLAVNVNCSLQPDSFTTSLREKNRLGVLGTEKRRMYLDSSSTTIIITPPGMQIRGQMQ